MKHEEMGGLVHLMGIEFKTIKDLKREFQVGALSASKLFTTLMARVEACQSGIGAFSDHLASSGRAEAQIADAGWRNSETARLLEGVPIAVKDIIDTTPARCKAGLQHLSNFRPRQDASVVAKLRQAGAVILGVTETDAGAFGTRTLQVINPIAPGRIVGGSSGGSAAVVCAGLAYGAIGTDTGGSIRIPAACCSITGFKPSWGRVDGKGVRPLAPSCDHIGPLARSVSDLKLIQRVLDPDLQESERPLPSQLKIGIDQAYYECAEPKVQQAMASAHDQLVRGGHELHAVELPAPDDFMPFHMINVAKEAADYHTTAFGEHWKDYPTVARDAIESGLEHTERQYQEAQRQKHLMKKLVDGVFETVDVLLAPTLPFDAPHRDVEVASFGYRELPILDGTVRYTALFDQTGHPALSLPAYLMSDGRAISLQINADAFVLDVGQILETSFGAKIEYSKLISLNAQEVSDKRRELR